MSRLSLFVLILIAYLKVNAFPENVRHGYFSCTACHVSPSGGGVLTPYGRSLSSELMSTWGTTKSSGFFFTDIEDEKKNPPWFRGQAFMRAVQVYLDNPQLEKARFIPMQSDLELGIDLDKFAVIASAGFRAKDTPNKLNDFFSRRHYFLYRFTENISSRLGKFIFSFGLNGPDHVTATRRGLGWDQGYETYNLELNYHLEKSSYTLTSVSNSPEEKNVRRDRAVAFSSNFSVFDKSKFGFNVYNGEQDASRRLVYGPHWIFSFSDFMYLNSELFWQNKKIKATDQNLSGYGTSHRLNYEFNKGVIPFFQLDRSHLDTQDENSLVDNYGVGLQFLPWSHFEFVGYVGQEKTSSQSASTYAWLMLNFYL